MRNVLILAGFSLLLACNNSPKEEVASISPNKDSSKSATTENISYPYTAGYSSKFEIGDPKNALTILNLWKDWDNGNLANSKNVFADTVAMYFWDGSTMHASRDSVLAAAQKMRNSYSSVKSRVDAFIPLKSTDKNENWVTVWGMETHTDKKGKVDSIALQETWRINKDGKTDLVYQFAAMPRPPKK